MTIIEFYREPKSKGRATLLVDFDVPDWLGRIILQVLRRFGQQVPHTPEAHGGSPNG